VSHPGRISRVSRSLAEGRMSRGPGLLIDWEQICRELDWAECVCRAPAQIARLNSARWRGLGFALHGNKRLNKGRSCSRSRGSMAEGGSRASAVLNDGRIRATMLGGAPSFGGSKICKGCPVPPAEADGPSAHSMNLAQGGTGPADGCPQRR